MKKLLTFCKQKDRPYFRAVRGKKKVNNIWDNLEQHRLFFVGGNDIISKGFNVGATIGYFTGDCIFYNIHDHNFLYFIAGQVESLINFVLNFRTGKLANKIASSDSRGIIFILDKGGDVGNGHFNV
jgi:hypothetical protein